MNSYKQCTAPGCTNKHAAKGYCRACYCRLLRHGSLEKLTSHRHGARLKEHELLIEELNSLFRAGKSRGEIHKAFEGLRGKTWVNTHYPGEKRPSIAPADVRARNKEELLAMHKAGHSMHDAFKHFEGRQSQCWVRAHWPRMKLKISSQLYAHMNITPNTRWAPIDD